MRVYLSASWKQRERVRALAEALRDEGHEVYDFTDPRCRKTPEIPYYKAAVHSNYEAIEWCDVVLLLLWCDQFLDRDEDVSGWLETLELEMPMRSRLPDLNSAAERLAGEVEYLYKQRAAIGSRCVDSLSRVLDDISTARMKIRPKFKKTSCTPQAHAPGCEPTDPVRVQRDCQPRSIPVSLSCASGFCATCNHGGPDGVPCGHGRHGRTNEDA